MSTCGPTRPADLHPHLGRAHKRSFVAGVRDATGLWLRSLGGGVFAALRGGLVAAITQDWLQVGVAV